MEVRPSAEGITILLSWQDIARMSLGHKQLTVRETQVLDFLRQRKTNKDIAEALHISVRTVKFHVSSLLEKLELSGRNELFAKGAL